MPHALTSPLLGLVALGILTASAGPARLSAALQSSTRTVYVSAIDNKGIPITDIQPAELEIKAGGKKLEVVSADPAQAPMRIVILVSDAGTGGFQAGVATFMQTLLGRAEFKLVSIITQPETVLDFSSEGGALREGIRKLGPRGRQRGGQLMETIYETAKTIGPEGSRTVILVARVGTEAISPLSGEEVREALRRSGAILHVLSSVGAERAAPSAARPGISAEQAQMQDEDNREGAMNLSKVLGDGSKESGGRHDQVISTTLIPSFERLANELLMQYAVKVAVPAGVKPTDKLSVSSTRRGAKVYAPSRLVH
jgi:hypothetical protein